MGGRGERWVLGSPCTQVCIPLRWEGMLLVASAPAPLPPPKWGTGRLKPAVTPDRQKYSLEQPPNC